jgi:hypothetical protein
MRKYVESHTNKLTKNLERYMTWFPYMLGPILKLLLSTNFKQLKSTKHFF